MKIKTDENLARRAVEMLRSAGHDVATVVDQGLSGRPDQEVFAACRSEQRILLTLDRDFGEPLRFPSEDSAGIVVLEIRGPATIQLLTHRIRQFLALADQRDVEGNSGSSNPVASESVHETTNRARRLPSATR